VKVGGQIDPPEPQLAGGGTQKPPKQHCPFMQVAPIGHAPPEPQPIDGPPSARPTGAPSAITPPSPTVPGPPAPGGVQNPSEPQVDPFVQSELLVHGVSNAERPHPDAHANTNKTATVNGARMMLPRRLAYRTTAW
jgi:hypothetical protein